MRRVRLTGKEELILIGTDTGTIRSALVYHHLVNDAVVLLDRLPFCMYVSLPDSLDIETLRNFMIFSYGFSHYKKTGKPASQREAKNRRDFAFYCAHSRHGSGTTKDEDDYGDVEEGGEERFARLNEDSDIVVVKGIKSVARTGHQQQYRITFNSHEPLLYFVARFRRDVCQKKNEEKSGAHVTVLDMKCKPFKGAPADYVEAQTPRHGVFHFATVARIARAEVTLIDGYSERFAAAETLCVVDYNTPLVILDDVLEPKKVVPVEPVKAVVDPWKEQPGAKNTSMAVKRSGSQQTLITQFMGGNPGAKNTSMAVKRSGSQQTLITHFMGGNKRQCI